MNSKLILAKGISIDKEYNNVLNYTENQMLSLLRTNTHLVAETNDYNFIRGTGTLKCGYSYATCLGANYMAFQNPDYSNKWFFAWIDNVIYKGDKNTYIEYTIDAWSTWFGSWTAKPCFVVREHVSDDTIGLHTIPENLNVETTIEEDEIADHSYSTSTGFWVIIQSSWRIKDGSTGQGANPLDKGEQFAGITVYNKNVFGVEISLFKITQLSDFLNVYRFIARTSSDEHIEDIQNMFIVPNALIDESNLTQHTAYVISNDNVFSWYTQTAATITAKTFNTTVSKRTSFTGFTPKNNKCFTYPYNYLLVTNNNGSNNIYKYEDFSTTNCVFENQLALSIGCSGRVVPKNYKGMTYNEDEALPLGKYPTCSWSSDAFTNWLTQNAVNIAVSVGLTAGSIAAAVMTGGAGTGAAAAAEMTAKEAAKAAAKQTALAVSTATTTASTMGNIIGQFHQASILPNINGGQATGDVLFASDNNKFIFRQMRVKNEYLQVIDDYFTRFGYQVNSLKTPNITGRTYWNYIQIGSSEEIGTGNIPNAHWDIINAVCRKGVTIWHNHDNIGNWNLSNTIVTP